MDNSKKQPLDADAAMRLIQKSPDSLAEFSVETLNDPTIASLLNSKDFVLEVLDPEDYDSGKYEWSGTLNPDWKRLTYLPVHWRNDADAMLLAVRCEMAIVRSQPGGSNHDWYLTAAPALYASFDDLFSIMSDDLMRNREFLGGVGTLMTEFFQETTGSNFNDYRDALSDHAKQTGERVEEVALLMDYSWNNIEDLHETWEFLKNYKPFWDPLDAPGNRNWIPDRLLQAVGVLGG
jgi:hypothetical protein